MDDDSKPRPNMTIQIDALPDAEELYASSSPSLPPSLPPPLPLPPGSSLPPASQPPPAHASQAPPAPDSKKVWIAALVIGCVMAGLGLLAGQLIAPDPPPEPAGTMEIGPIEME